MDRIFNYDIMEEIKDRWSPRAFSREEVKIEDIYAIIEAARYAPSCFNEQPWRFIIANEKVKLEKMRNILTENNKIWASKAPVLIMVLSSRTFSHNDKENYWHMFDAGTAWGFMALEAKKRGLITHAMGGFSKKKAREEFNIQEDYSIIAVIALGKYGDIKDLPAELAEREKPGTRKNFEDVILKY